MRYLYIFTILTLALVPSCKKTYITPQEEAAAPEVGADGLPIIVVCDNSATSATDSDGDGLPDSVELTGWSIMVDPDGFGLDHAIERTVFSDPYICDTDNDGLNDLEEYAALTDPTMSDTDLDLLSDSMELFETYSHPNSVDSDGDSYGDGFFPSPQLFDGHEYLTLRTSPILADTDGDGLSDAQETLGGGFNPLKSDIMKLSLRVVGDPLVALNVEVTSTDGTTSNNAFSRSIAQEDSTSASITNSSTSGQVSETSSEWHAEATISGSYSSPFSASVSGSATAGGGETSNFSSSTSQGFQGNSTSAAASSVASDFNSATQVDTNETISFSDGQIAVAMAVKNDSNLVVEVQDLRVLCFKINSGRTSSMTLMGELIADVFDSSNNSDPVLMAPGQEVIFQATNNSLNANIIKSYLESPTGFIFEVGSYTAIQPEQIVQGVPIPEQNYSVIGQNVEERTGQLVIDFGGGLIEKYQIATNVRRNENGAGSGISVQEALEFVLNKNTSTTEFTNPATTASEESITRNLLSGIDGFVASQQNESEFRAWLVIADEAQEAGLEWNLDDGNQLVPANVPKNFSDIMLKTGERVHLVFLKDSDLDNLMDREEFRAGTNPLLQDTDLDGLSDYEELNGRRIVLHQPGEQSEYLEANLTQEYVHMDRLLFSSSNTIQILAGYSLTEGEEITSTERTVYSNPKLADTDQDGLTDLEEMEYKTDPTKRDTDLDGRTDYEEVEKIMYLTQSGNHWQNVTSLPEVQVPFHVGYSFFPLHSNAALWFNFPFQTSPIVVSGGTETNPDLIPYFRMGFEVEQATISDICGTSYSYSNYLYRDYQPDSNAVNHISIEGNTALSITPDNDLPNPIVRAVKFQDFSDSLSFDDFTLSLIAQPNDSIRTASGKYLLSEYYPGYSSEPSSEIGLPIRIFLENGEYKISIPTNNSDTDTGFSSETLSLGQVGASGASTRLSVVINGNTVRTYRNTLAIEESGITNMQSFDGSISWLGYFYFGSSSQKDPNANYHTNFFEQTDGCDDVASIEFNSWYGSVDNFDVFMRALSHSEVVEYHNQN